MYDVYEGGSDMPDSHGIPQLGLPSILSSTAFTIDARS